MEKYRGPITKLLMEQWNDTVRPFRRVNWVKKEDSGVKVLIARRRKNGR